MATVTVPVEQFQTQMHKLQEISDLLGMIKDFETVKFTTIGVEALLVKALSCQAEQCAGSIYDEMAAVMKEAGHEI